jgi:hypothetical protein
MQEQLPALQAYQLSFTFAALQKLGAPISSSSIDAVLDAFAAQLADASPSDTALLLVTVARLKHVSSYRWGGIQLSLSSTAHKHKLCAPDAACAGRLVMQSLRTMQLMQMQQHVSAQLSVLQLLYVGPAGIMHQPTHRLASRRFVR